MAIDPSLAINGVRLEIYALLGRSQMPVHQLLKMGRGAVIELDSSVDADVKLYIGNRKVAEGELIVSGEKLAINVNRMSL